ncbi:Mevalonate kinase [Zea mays]|uniref:Mevalonate kinase n=2 Tax=Zea mays TaxID=4577 RepID=A0A1D6HI38_MAIZE|nr:Mevalonate kinase [Zea mays]
MASIVQRQPETANRPGGSDTRAFCLAMTNWRGGSVVALRRRWHTQCPAMDPVAGMMKHRGPLEVSARAPVKIILAGEHAVIHGSAAVAAAIDLYTNSSSLLRPAGPGEGGDAGSGAVELDLRDSGLTFSWPCSRLRGALGEEISTNPGAPAPCSPDQLAAIARLLQD